MNIKNIEHFRQNLSEMFGFILLVIKFIDQKYSITTVVCRIN